MRLLHAHQADARVRLKDALCFACASEQVQNACTASRAVPVHDQLAECVFMRLMRHVQVYAVSAYPSFSTMAPSNLGLSF